MELLHTFEEIKYFSELQDLQQELKELGTRYNKSEILDLASKYQSELESELEEYSNYIGIECKAPPSSLSKNKEYRNGRIEGNFYFNAYSKSVRCDFRYSSGGFDTHAIKELIT